MFILRVFFIGMIAFVPQRGGKALYVLLPNSTHQMGNVSAHYPIFTFSQSNVVGLNERNEWPKIKVLINGREDKDSLGWYLAGERIQLPKGGLPFTLAKTRKKTSLLPLNDEESWDFTWVPLLSQVIKSPAPVKRRLITNPSQEDLSAILKLSSGHLRTYSLSRYIDAVGHDRNALISFSFATAGTQSTEGNCEQALAEIEVAEIPVMSPSVVIEANSFDGKSSSKVTLKPRPGESTVDVLLANLPPSDPDEMRKNSLPLHFAHYYDLLDKAIKTPERLVPVFCTPKKSGATELGIQPDLAPIPPPELYMRTVFENAGRASIARPICASAVLDPVQ